MANEHKGTERSRRIVVNREYKEVNGKLVSRERKASGSAHGKRDKNTRFRIGEGQYGFNDLTVVSVEYRNASGRRETEWHIKKADGSLLKKADTLGIAWKYLEANHRI